MNEQIDTISTNEEVFKYYTEKAGDINRQFGLVAVGLIWLFHGIEVSSGQELLKSLDTFLKFALYCTSISLSIDLFQYIIGSLMWHSEFIRDPTGKASKCRKSIGVSVGLIVIKLISMLSAYISILLFLFFRTNFI
jgi:hypothetical protein